MSAQQHRTTRGPNGGQKTTAVERISTQQVEGAVQQSTVRLHAKERLWESQKATGRVIELLPRERIESRD